MTDQQQRTQWALDRFRSFVNTWVAPGVTSMQEVIAARDRVDESIRAIAPKNTEPIGWAVFQREIDADWDIRQHPSGFVHTLTSAVFDKLGHAQNAHQGASKRHPQNQYVICEIREVP